MGKQLYTEYDSVSVPDKAMPVRKTGAFIGKPRIIRNFVLIRWPNGRPCNLANLWMDEICASTGARDSARVDAALITHFVRFCSVKNIQFSNFNETNFQDFTKQLVEETKSTLRGIEPARNNNRTRLIQHTMLNFLHWLTENYPNLSKTPLIGLKNSGANITISYETNPKTKRCYMVHPLLVAPVPYNDDKVAIDEHIIQKIQDEIFRKRDWEDLPASSRLKSISDLELYDATSVYLYERRMFTLRMMKLTGLRPEELFDLDLELNQNISNTLEIVIPTKKRGTPAPLRRFKINAADARRFAIYVEARKAYIDFLADRNILFDQPNNIFLGENGSRLKKESITKEFDRLCLGAGLSGTRVCLSMFRHRFVTRQINIRLEERFAQTPALKKGWTPALRDDVCAEVAQLTGHSDPASLHHYFHAEYKALTSSSTYSSMLEAQDELDSVKDTLTALEHRSKLQKIDMSVEIRSVKALVEKLEMRLSSRESAE
ncbi:site-specific integrase [Pseudomonas sp. PB103]|uniref:hypothetical protein n=1 Tax=Pseudomonas sp. PB103 TaxID=2494698 RepID=UPI00131ABDCD|nr:hypothetical protein [Pseudomonas sp. PB103]KAE9642563.1 site-specific integrase [Pseudomonas sp. PB103]